MPHLMPETVPRVLPQCSLYKHSCTTPHVSTFSRGVTEFFVSLLSQVHWVEVSFSRENAENNELVLRAKSSQDFGDNWRKKKQLHNNNHKAFLRVRDYSFPNVSDREIVKIINRNARKNTMAKEKMCLVSSKGFGWSSCESTMEKMQEAGLTKRKMCSPIN